MPKQVAKIGIHTPMLNTSSRYLATGLVLLLWLVGCTMDVGRLTRGGSGPVSSSSLANSGDRARLRLQAQDLQGRATNSPPPLRDQLYMQAAQVFLKADDRRAAEAAAAEVNPARLPDADEFDWKMLNAELKLKQTQPVQAIAELGSLRPAALSPEQQLSYYPLLADAQEAAGNHVDSARSRMTLDPLLKTTEARRDNQLRLVRGLTQLSDSSLELLQPNPPGVLGGWMELARIAKRHANDFTTARGEIEHWRQRFPDHPAPVEQLSQGQAAQGTPQTAAQNGEHNLAGPDSGATFKTQHPASTQPLSQLAVLLPLSGPLKEPAAAIRNGIMAAHQAVPAQDRPRVKFYDASNTKAMDELYQQAIAEGAAAVIGPLDKEGTAQLIQRGDLPLPTLALNRVDSSTQPPKNLFQFALAPEDEAAQVAERIWADGHRQALMLTPDSAWGQRVADAFSQRWRSLGGTLLEQKVYKEKEHDFSLVIRQLLKIGTTVAQHKAQQRQSGSNRPDQPQRRTDADVLFLAASPEKAREIRPQLQFNFAADLPLYATSRIYEGTPDSRLDRDLNGIHFPDQPWLLVNGTDALSREAVAKLFPSSRNRLPRLHAMGIDAYQLVFRLGSMAADPSRTFAGKTGLLRLDERGQVRGRLVWANMTQGVPRLLDRSQMASPE